MSFWDFLDTWSSRLIVFVRWLVLLGISAFIGYLLGAWLGGGIIADRFTDTDFGNAWVWAWLICWPVMFCVSVAWWKALIVFVVLVLLAGVRIDGRRGLSFYGYY